MDIEIAKSSLLTATSKPIGHISDKAPALEVWYDGSAVSGTTTTAATVKYATDTFTFYINGAVDSRIGSSGVVDCNNASYNTFGELSAHINSVDGWHMRLKGVLESGSADATLLDRSTAVNCLRTAVDFLIDTDAMDIHSFCISNAEGPTAVKRGSTEADKVKAIYDERGAVNCLFYLKFTATLTGVATGAIYSINGATHTENLIGTMVFAATTVANTYDFSDFPITANPGERLVVLITEGTGYTTVDEALINAKSIQTH